MLLARRLLLDLFVSMLGQRLKSRRVTDNILERLLRLLLSDLSCHIRPLDAHDLGGIVSRKPIIGHMDTCLVKNVTLSCHAWL